MSRDHRVDDDNRDLRSALGQFPTGVAVVTARAGDLGPVGMTINSFASISLEPPLISWCIDRSAAGYRTFAAVRRFAVTVLAEDQKELAIRFATRGADKFRGIDLEPGDAPLVPGGSAWFKCETYGMLPLGDHTMLLGKVVEFARNPVSPLAFGGGRFQQLSPISGAARDAA